MLFENPYSTATGTAKYRSFLYLSSMESEQAVRDPKKYVGISLPPALVDQVRPYVARGAYRSLAEFVKEAIRLRLGQLRALEGIGQKEEIGHGQ